MSSNIEAIRQDYAELAKTDPRMMLVVKQLGIAAELSDEFDGPKEIPGFKKAEPESYIGDLNLMPRIVEFFAHNPGVENARLRQGIAIKFNGEIGKDIPDYVQLTELQIPHLDKLSAEIGYKAKLISRSAKSFYNRSLFNLVRGRKGPHDARREGMTVGQLRGLDRNARIYMTSPDALLFIQTSLVTHIVLPREAPAQ